MDKDAYIRQLQINSLTDGEMRINALKGIGAGLDAQGALKNEIEALKAKANAPMATEIASAVSSGVATVAGVLAAPLKAARDEIAYLKEQLSRPLMDIINENKEYRDAFEEQRETLENWMVSQNSFKKLAFEYGKKIGKNTEDVTNEMRIEKEIIIEGGIITKVNGDVSSHLRVINKNNFFSSPV